MRPNQVNSNSKLIRKSGPGLINHDNVHMNERIS